MLALEGWLKGIHRGERAVFGIFQLGKPVSLDVTYRPTGDHAPGVWHIRGGQEHADRYDILRWFAGSCEDLAVTEAVLNIVERGGHQVYMWDPIDVKLLGWSLHGSDLRKRAAA